MFGKNSYPVKRSETVKVLINNVNTRQYKFSDNETTLVGRKFKGIIVHTAALTKSFDGDDLVTDAIAKKAYVTLSDRDNNQMIKRLPLEVFFNSNGVIFIELDNLEIDLRKSFIDLQDTTGATAGMAFVFTFFYE